MAKVFPVGIMCFDWPFAGIYFHLSQPYCAVRNTYSRLRKGGDQISRKLREIELDTLTTGAEEAAWPVLTPS